MIKRVIHFPGFISNTKITPTTNIITVQNENNSAKLVDNADRGIDNNIKLITHENYHYRNSNFKIKINFYIFVVTKFK